MKFTIIITILAIAFGWCLGSIWHLHYDDYNYEQPKIENFKYEDTPTYYKQYHKHTVFKKRKIFIVE